MAKPSKPGLEKGGSAEAEVAQQQQEGLDGPGRSHSAGGGDAGLLWYSRASFSGPLPHPEAIQAYEKTLPGAADRIFTMAETQAGHRQALEKQVVSGDLRKESQGQWMAFILFLVTLVGGFYLLSIDKDVTGIAAIVTALATPLALFVYKQRSGQKELDNKRADSD